MLNKFALSSFILFSLSNSAVFSMDSVHTGEMDPVTRPRGIGILQRDTIVYDNGKELLYQGMALSEFPRLADKAILLEMCDQKSNIDELISGHFKTPHTFALTDDHVIESLHRPSANKNTECLLSTDPEINQLIVRNDQKLFTKAHFSTETIDNRQKVIGNYARPNNAITTLEIQFHAIKDKKSYQATYFGSGVVINSRFVATAAHNIFDSDSGYIANSIKAFPGADAEAIYWEGTSHDYFVHPLYIASQSPKYDIALIDFGDSFQKAPQQPGLFSFGFGLGSYSVDKLMSKTLHVTGYPGIAKIDGQLTWLGGKTMMSCEGKLHEKTSEKMHQGKLLYLIDTTKGNSGSPVYFIE